MQALYREDIEENVQLRNMIETVALLENNQGLDFEGGLMIGGTSDCSRYMRKR
jgi:hypothetical protein